MSSSADSSSADHDPVRSSPPEDPWLTEAPTSAFGETPAPGHPPPADTARSADPASLGDPPADAARFADPVSFDGPSADTARFADPVPGHRPPADTARLADPVPFGDPPSPRRGRRAIRWAVAVLAAAALFIAGMLAIDQFGSGADGNHDGLGPGPSTGAGDATSALTTAPTGSTTVAPAGGISVAPAGGPTAGPAGDPSAAPAGGPPSASRPADSAGGPLVIYEVTASGSDNTGSVSYTDQDGDIIRRDGIKLPWRVAFRLGGQRKPPLVLISQRKGGGDAGPVTCSITLGGKVLSSTTAEGRYAAPQCSG
jgi:hypothetical protein